MRAGVRVSVSAVVACMLVAAPADAAKVGCKQKAGAEFPGAFDDRNNLVVGPLVLVGWHRAASEVFATVVGRQLGWKMPLLVRDGRRVTVRIAAEARQRAQLSYGRGPAARQITFTACSREKGERSWSSVDGEPVTFWAGGVSFESAPACVPIQFRHDRSKVWRTRTLRLATTDC